MGGEDIAGKGVAEDIHSDKIQAKKINKEIFYISQNGNTKHEKKYIERRSFKYENCITSK